MSSLALLSRSFQPAAPLAIGASADALVAPVNGLSAFLRNAFAPIAGRVRQWRRASAAEAVRQRGLAFLATDPSYAADLLAAADAHETHVERA